MTQSVKCSTYIIFIHKRNLQTLNSFLDEETLLSKNIILPNLAVFSGINFIKLFVGAGKANFMWKPAEACILFYDWMHKMIHCIILNNFHSSLHNICLKIILRWVSVLTEPSSTYLTMQEILPLRTCWMLLWWFYSSRRTNICIIADLQSSPVDNVRANGSEFFPDVLSFYVSTWQIFQLISWLPS